MPESAAATLASSISNTLAPSLLLVGAAVAGAGFWEVANQAGVVVDAGAGFALMYEAAAG